MDSPTRPVSETELLENLAWVQALARRLVSDPATAEDVAQDAWLAARERPPRRARSGAGLRAWLARVTRTLARQSFRSESARSARERAVARREATPSAGDVVARAEMQKRIVEAVLALEEPGRTTILLRHLDGLSARAISERRGETPEAVRQRLSRALEALRARLERELGGTRRSMERALLPLVTTGWRGVEAAGIGEILGGTVVSKSAMALGGALVVAAVAVGIWLQGGGVPEAAEPGEPEAKSAEVVAVDEEGVEGRSEEVDIVQPLAGEPGRDAVPAETGAAAASYLVLDPEGRGVPDARAVLCHEGAVLARGETDEEGTLATEVSLEGDGRLLLEALGWAPQVHEVPLAPGLHEVRLRPGAAVSGWIVVDGGTPWERIPLLLRSDRGYVKAEEELGIGAEEVGLDRGRHRVAKARAGMDGSFRFDGLPPGWAGALELPADYRLSDQTLARWDFRPNGMSLDGPVEGLRVEVVKRLALTGRIIDFPRRVPVGLAGAFVEPRLEFPKEVSGQQYQGLESTDELGRFRFAPLSSSILGGFLLISDPDREIHRQIPIEPRELREDWDLGDLALSDADEKSTLRLLVQDPAGDPIAGAIVGSGDSGPISAATDASGRTSLRGVVPGLSTIGVYCPGYEAAAIPVPLDPPEELIVEMRRGTLLEIRFLKPSGEVAPSVAARLLATEHPYRDAGTIRGYQAYTRSGCSFPMFFDRGEQGVVARLHALREGRVILNDIKPGVPLRLRVEGTFGTTIQEQEIAALGPGEHRRVKVRLERGPRTLRGCVLDEAGRPLPTAFVGVSYHPPDHPQNYSRSMGRGVEEDGSFSVGNIYARTVNLHVRAEGCVPFADERFEIPEDDAPVEFRLSPAHVVTVHVEDESGERVPASFVKADLPTGATVYGREVKGEVGAYILRGLPDEEVVVEAWVHAVSYRETCDPREETLLITVPILGRVEADVRLFKGSQLEGDCVLWLLPGSDEELKRRGEEVEPGFSKPVIVEGVLPGSYDAVLRRHSAGRWSPEDPFEDLSPRVPILVQPRVTTSVELWVD